MPNEASEARTSGKARAAMPKRALIFDDHASFSMSKSCVREAFDAVLAKGRPAYVSHYRLEPEEIIALIKGAGGTPVLAHPKLVGDDALVEHVLDLGMEGIEAFYPQHDTVDTQRYVDMAERRHLLVTGGSDFHGFASRYPQELGIFTVEDSFAEKLYKPRMNL